MKAAVALICVFLVAYAAGEKPALSPSSSPAPPPASVNCDIDPPTPNDVILLPDPQSCEHFYICVGLKPVKTPCPKGLHYNKELRVCDWPESADCTIY